MSIQRHTQYERERENVKMTLGPVSNRKARIFTEKGPIYLRLSSITDIASKYK